MPERAGQVVLLHGDDVADRPVLDPLDRFPDAVVVTPAQAGDDVEILLRAISVVSSTRRTPGPSTATGFSQNTCLPFSMAYRR